MEARLGAQGSVCPPRQASVSTVWRVAPAPPYSEYSTPKALGSKADGDPAMAGPRWRRPVSRGLFMPFGARL